MIQNFVKLTEPGHAYADLNGQPYTSVSKVLDSLEEAQDWWKIAGNCAGNGKYVGMTQQQVFDAWDKNKVSAGNSGTRGHNALECYSKTFNVPEGSEDLLPMAKSVHADYKDYYGTEEEACLYYKRDGFLIAGTTDKILRVKKKGGLVDMCDYKFNPTGITYKSKDNKYLKHPVSHLQDCKFNRYAIQLSIYGVIYESLTD